VPGLANNEQLGIRRGRYIIKLAEMEDIFEPIILKVIKLVQGQMLATKKKIRAVLLVGGFGQNNYLKDRLRSFFDKNIEILQPTNSWTAVVRGAVMMGLAHADAKLASVGIVSRAARKHYGIELSSRYDPALHQAKKK
jgi:molecular chaperone DnaK (HSP70)